MPYNSLCIRNYNIYTILKCYKIWLLLLLIKIGFHDDRVSYFLCAPPRPKICIELKMAPKLSFGTRKFANFGAKRDRWLRQDYFWRQIGFLGVLSFSLKILAFFLRTWESGGGGRGAEMFPPKKVIISNYFF